MVGATQTHGDMAQALRHTLHIADPLNPSVGACGCALLAGATESSRSRRPTVQHDVLLIGPATAERLASSAGLSTQDRISPPHGSSWAGLTAFRRYVRHVVPSAGIDLVHAWSLRSLSLAAIGLPNTPRLVTLTHGPDSSEAARWLAAVIRCGAKSASTTALAISNAVKREWVQAGVPSESLHVVRPGIDLSRVRHTHRQTLLEQWRAWVAEQGATGWTNETQIIGVLADDVRRTDLLRAARILGLSRLAGHDAAMIVPAGRRRAAYRLINGLERSAAPKASVSAGLLVVDDRLRTEPWNVLPALDVALVLGDDTTIPVDGGGAGVRRASGIGGLLTGLLHRVRRQPADRIATTSPGVLPMLWAAAAGVPIVGEASYAVSEVIEHEHSGLLVRPGDDRGLIRRLEELRSDAQAQWKLSDTARSEAFSFFSPSRYQRDLETVYEQIASREPIVVPELPMTGGLAFSGRV